MEIKKILNIPDKFSILFKKRSLFILIVILIFVIGLSVIYMLIKNKATFDLNRNLNQNLTNQEQTPALTFAQSLIPINGNYSLEAQKGPFTCPISSSLCQNSNSYKQGALALNVPKKSNIVALFDGNLASLDSIHPDSKGDEKFNLAILYNTSLGLQSMYYFKGEFLKNTSVKAGEVIAISSGELLSFKDNKSFVLELLATNNQQNFQIQLSKDNFNR